MKAFPLLLFFLPFLYACTPNDPEPKPFFVRSSSIDGQQVYPAKNIGPKPQILVQFNKKIDTVSLGFAVNLHSSSGIIPTQLTIENDSLLIIIPKDSLPYLTSFDLLIDQRMKDTENQFIENTFSLKFYTGVDPTYKFPLISDEALLDTIQKRTFRYFWDFAHPVSGLIRERNTSGDLVTTGGSGFGVMAIIVGIERGYITRQQGMERMTTITQFLKDKADRFHGVFPHWLSGTTGKTIPFSQKDNGGDLVETSFLIAGLLSASEYFNQNTNEENTLRETIQSIWESVEWNWHTKGGEDVLYWHWSPNFNWEMNHKIQGYNEALITYILAAASPTFPISKEAYEKGWSRNGQMKSGKNFYGINLPLGFDFGGPLFFTHYSFLGIDPRNLKDQYADYWVQNVNHTLINREYCITNPRKFTGYSADCWGLTASDNNGGYSAHSPTNDRGVITPTAAISSLPYTPEESMQAIRYFYYVLGDKLFKNYGFTDAFNLHDLWFASSFLAIDQGPIIIMIENHRTGLLWETTMKNQDIQNGLQKLGFTY